MSDLILFFIGAGLLIWLIYLGATSMGYNWQWYPRATLSLSRHRWRTHPRPADQRPARHPADHRSGARFWRLRSVLLTALLRLSRSVAGHGIATVYLEVGAQHAAPGSDVSLLFRPVADFRYRALLDRRHLPRIFRSGLHQRDHPGWHPVRTKRTMGGSFGVGPRMDRDVYTRVWSCHKRCRSCCRR